MAIGKKVNELVPYDDASVAAGNLLIPMADPVSGISGYGTINQILLAAIAPIKYVATGAEGTTLTIGALAGKTILLATRESSIMYEVASAPDSTEYIWDGTDITLGVAAGPGERFKFIYR